MLGNEHTGMWFGVLTKPMLYRRRILRRNPPDKKIRTRSVLLFFVVIPDLVGEPPVIY
jgi:hypothetical protein